MYSNENETTNLLCKIYTTNELSVLFMPCKYFACCMNCSVALGQCCICKKICGYCKVYFS